MIDTVWANVGHLEFPKVRLKPSWPAEPSSALLEHWPPDSSCPFSHTLLAVGAGVPELPTFVTIEESGQLALLIRLLPELMPS